LLGFKKLNLVDYEALSNNGVQYNLAKNIFIQRIRHSIGATNKHVREKPGDL